MGFDPRLPTDRRFDQLADSLDSDDSEAFDGFTFSGQVSLGDNGCFEAMFCRFAQSFLAVGYRADLACQADFTKGEYIIG